MTLRTLLAAVTLGASALTAMAAGIAVGKKLEVTVDANKVAEETTVLWAKYGGWCAIKDWHPAVASCEETAEGDVKFRTLTLKDGGKIKEKLVDSGTTSYRYEIIESPFPVQNYTAQFAITPDDDDLNEINFSWAATFDAKDKPDDEAKKVITGVIEAGIASLKTLTGGAKPDAK